MTGGRLQAAASSTDKPCTRLFNRTMEGLVVPRLTICACVFASLAAASGMLFVENCHAETEIFAGGGSWIPFLPDYEAGSIVNGGSVLERGLLTDNQSDLGAQFGINGLHRIGNSSRQLEFDLGVAFVGDMTSNITVDDPGAGGSVWFASLDGSGVIASADSENAVLSLDSDVLHFNEYVGIRDRFQCPILGPVELGVGFAHLSFDQNFDFNAVYSDGDTGRYLEDLTTNYFGGELRGRIARRMRSQNVWLDFGLGLFTMDADYQGVSEIRGTTTDDDSVNLNIEETAMTFDLAVMSECELWGCTMRRGMSLKYLSDMPFIDHPMTEVAPPEPVRLGSRNSFFVGFTLEVLLWDTCSCCCN